jgi:hypothetical protein
MIMKGGDRGLFQLLFILHLERLKKTIINFTEYMYGALSANSTDSSVTAYAWM